MKRKITKSIEPGDLVTIDGADERVWRVEQIGTIDRGGQPRASLAHSNGTRTSTSVTRLKHATMTEIASPT